MENSKHINLALQYSRKFYLPLKQIIKHYLINSPLKANILNNELLASLGAENLFSSVPLTKRKDNNNPHYL